MAESYRPYRIALGVSFYRHCSEHWDANAPDVLDWMVKNDPANYFKVMAALCKIDRVELSRAPDDDFAGARDHQEIIMRLEQRSGPIAAAVLRQYIARSEGIDDPNGNGGEPWDYLDEQGLQHHVDENGIDMVVVGKAEGNA